VLSGQKGKTILPSFNVKVAMSGGPREDRRGSVISYINYYKKNFSFPVSWEYTENSLSFDYALSEGMGKNSTQGMG
jgi:hypothetical protein